MPVSQRRDDRRMLPSRLVRCLLGLLCAMVPALSTRMLTAPGRRDGLAIRVAQQRIAADADEHRQDETEDHDALAASAGR
jgi:hypothetical protein